MRFLRSAFVCAVVSLLMVPASRTSPAPSWAGVLRDKSGNPIARAIVTLHAKGDRTYSAKTSATGEFSFAEIAAGSYELSVSLAGKNYVAANPLIVEAEKVLTATLELSLQEGTLVVFTAGTAATAKASGGEHLSGGAVSSLPLNERDFSKLLLLAAG